MGEGLCVGVGTAVGAGVDVGVSVGTGVDVGTSVGLILAFVGVGIGFFVGEGEVCTPATSVSKADLSFSGSESLLGSGDGNTETSSLVESGTREDIKNIEPVTTPIKIITKLPVKSLGLIFSIPTLI